MTDTPSASPTNALGDDLPPVQPPSAGFIVQLFVVPALIVLAVVVVWALFGRLAAGEQDWQRLVQDLQSPNPHVHRRAMFGLAQVLDNDQRQKDRGQRLAANRQIATALAEQFGKSLATSGQDEESLSLQVYLSRALGLLDVPDATVPVLAQALEPQRDVEVRKGAVTSLALIAGRALDRGEPLGEDAVEALIELSQDGDPTLRRAAGFALGLTPSPASEERLKVLLEDGDHMTAVNAAVGLARQKSTAGFQVFLQALSSKLDGVEPAVQQETVLIQKNVLKAVAELGPQFNAEERSQLRTAITPLANDHPEPRIRIEAHGALAALSVSGG
jgi:HEAT repeat protein